MNIIVDDDHQEGPAVHLHLFKSLMRWIYREDRSRLAVERAKKMAFISANRRLLRKRHAPDEEDNLQGV
jgi:hypothetical protein